MNDKKLRKISKKELLEILLEQAKRIEELEMELSNTQKKLDSKIIDISSTGSLAEAVLKLNGIFEKAQETADQYLMNVKEKCTKIENDTKEICDQKKKEADEYLISIQKKTKPLKKTKDKKVNDNLSKNKKQVQGKKTNISAQKEACEKIVVN